MGDNLGNQNPSEPNPISGMLTYPSRSNEEPQPYAEQPRQPTNLQGLLRFAMEATKAEDAPSNSQMAPMDDDRRRFLEEALRSLTVDMAEVIRRAIDILNNVDRMRCIRHNDVLPDDVTRSFENLLELIDDIDVANDFYKMGGFSIFPSCLSSPNDTVRAKACAVLGEVCQNNSYCQAKALETGLVRVLLGLAESEQGEPLVKCLYALSCACREYEPSCTALVSGGGCALLARLLAAPERAARCKAGFLMRHLSTHHKAAREEFIRLEVIKRTTEVIKRSARDDSTPFLLGVILSLAVTLDARVLRQLRDPNVELRETLGELLEHPAARATACTEEKDICMQLLHILDGPEGDEVDFELDR